VDGRPNRRNNAAFSNSSGIVGLGLKGSREFGRDVGAVLYFLDFDWRIGRSF